MTKKKQKYTVLLLSAPIGSGHRLAAEALREAFAEHERWRLCTGTCSTFFHIFWERPSCAAICGFWAAALGCMSWPINGVIVKVARCGCVA